MAAARTVPLREGDLVSGAVHVRRAGDGTLHVSPSVSLRFESQARKGEILVSCWCERRVGIITRRRLLRGETFSCGHRHCRPGHAPGGAGVSPPIKVLISPVTGGHVALAAERPRRDCPHGDRFCPCQDGDACHYEQVGDSPPSRCLRTGIVGCTTCRR